ncbi:unnamed protein product, partial [Rotaria magnacalcarata]
MNLLRHHEYHRLKASILKVRKSTTCRKNNNKTIGDAIDVSISCQDRPAQPKLSSYTKNHANKSFVAN